MNNHTNSANNVWLNLAANILENGIESAPRGYKIKELLAYQSVIDMRWPVVTSRSRGLSHQFMAAEALWIMRGDNRLRTIINFAPSIANFSDDQETFFGAYGPKFVGQLDYVLNAFKADLDTRQAVMNIWRENPPKSKDIPCTISVQWIIRDGVIYCVDTMRSSDVWLGWPYDVFNFTVLTMLIALHLRDAGIHVKLGTLTLNAGSQHLYLKNELRMEEVLMNERSEAMYAPLSVSDWQSPFQFVDHLQQIQDARTLTMPWLREIVCLNHG